MIFRTLLAHYVRHPMQALFLLAGIVIANVLLVGTQLINAQARSSYAQGDTLAGVVGQVVPTGTARYLDERLFIDLRRQGFANTTPVLRQVLRTDEGQVIELLGIDVLSIPRTKRDHGGQVDTAITATAGANGFDGFAFPPYRTLVAPARLAELGIESGEAIALASGKALPAALAVDSDQLGYRMLIDIGALQNATDRAGQLTAILVSEGQASDIERLEAVLPAGVEYVSASSSLDPSELTESFHLNLAAMGLLACVVGLFLTYNAIAFSFSDRRELLRRMRLAGVSRRSLAIALSAELAVFLILGGGIGLWLGALLAGRLLPGVGQTLVQLYDVYIAYPDSLLSQGYWIPLLSAALAAMACAVFPMREALNAPLLARRHDRWHLSQTARRDKQLALAGIGLLLGSALLAISAWSIWVALGGMAALLLGAALCLPLALRGLLALLQQFASPQSAKLSWLIADSRWLLGPAALALMAMLLALVANSGLNAMVTSFRAATDAWLEQRLVAQLYVRDPGNGFSDTDGPLLQWLGEFDPQVRMTLRHAREVNVTSQADGIVVVEVVDLANREPFRSSVELIRKIPDAMSDFHAGEGLLISERAWRLDGWQVGDAVNVCGSVAPLRVLGVYHDYGNPRSQLMLPPEHFERCWPDPVSSGIALHGPGSVDWDALRLALIQQFDLRDTDVTDQRQLRRIALTVFDRTFVITQALNGLTLLVAGIGVFCAVSAIHHHRVGQQALLASLGLSRLERGGLLLAQWGIMGLLCVLVVGPFGLALGAYLSSVVTPVAFGWSFPLKIDLAPLVTLAAVACVALVLAVLLPSLRLLRVSPATLLREHSS